MDHLIKHPVEPGKTTPLLLVEDLTVQFKTDRGPVTAVDHVSFSVKPGEIVGIVGESGSGKSVMCQSILRLLEHTDPVSATGFTEGTDIFGLDPKPSGPPGQPGFVIFRIPDLPESVYTIGNQVGEVLRLHKGMNRQEHSAERWSCSLTGIRSLALHAQYPHELSGACNSG